MNALRARLPAMVMLLSLAALAQGVPGEQSPVDQVLERFSENVTFHCGFDAGVADADLAVGQAKPRGTEGAVTFVPGLYGQALASGQVTYVGGPNLSWATPGTVLMWVSISRNDPDAPEGYLFPLRIFGGDKTTHHARLMIGKIDRFNKCFLYAHVQSSVGTKAMIHGPSTLRWQPDEWHLIALSWRPGSFELSVDGVPFRMKAAPDLPAPGTWFILAAYSNPETGLRCLIDDVTIVDRPLSGDEVRWVWKTWLKAPADDHE